MTPAFALLAGTLFGFGLAWSGMTDPRNVLDFLDPGGRWNPGLALVMASALIVASTGFALARRRSRPLAADRFHLPEGRRIDAPLVLGSALFGLGWGVAGYCPGPAFAALGFGSLEAIFFVLAMVAGSWFARRFASPAR